MSFVWCLEERRYAEPLEVYIGELGDDDTVPPTSLALLFLLYPYARL